MSAIGGSVYADSVISVYINHEKKFAFVEFRTVEEASNAMALDGIVYEVGRVMRKKRKRQGKQAQCVCMYVCMCV